MLDFIKLCAEIVGIIAILAGLWYGLELTGISARIRGCILAFLIAVGVIYFCNHGGLALLHG
jgi:hypothetical protein